MKMAVFTRNEGVRLFNDAIEKFATSSDGVNVYGNINMTVKYYRNDQMNIFWF